MSNFLKEGINDPGILKCVFMAGGPGSGKSTIASNLFGIAPAIKNSSLSSFGLKVLNSDIAYEYLLRKNGIDPKNIALISKVNPEKAFQLFSPLNPDSYFSKAKKITDSIKNAYFSGRLGLIVDGTGRNFDSIKDKKEEIEKLGYDTAMVFVYTDLETALNRNRNRDRQLADDVVIDTYDHTISNLKKYQSLFKNNFFLVDTSPNKKIEDGIKKATARFVTTPIKNPIGRRWLKFNTMKKHTNNLTEKLDLFLEKNVPTDPSKWNYWKNQAKKKFDVYPSAYANGWAAKMYKKAGGGWKTEESFLRENDHEVGMAQNHLNAIIQDASELKNKIGDMEINLPGWIQDHISQAYNYLKQATDGYHEIE